MVRKRKSMFMETTSFSFDKMIIVYEFNRMKSCERMQNETLFLVTTKKYYCNTLPIGCQKW